VKEAGKMRQITIGVNKVAEEPVDADFEDAAVYIINLPQDSSLFTIHSSLLTINYQGDCHQLELRILPLQKDMPVYFPREADTTPGERVINITIDGRL